MFTLMVMCGLPGSGKSFFAESYCKNHSDYTVVSTDKIRGELFGDESDQSNNWLVFVEAYRRILSALDNSNVIFDATNLTRKNRSKVIKYFRKVSPNTKLICMCMGTPIEVCLIRNKNRDRKVDEEVILNMLNKFELPTLEEGWDDVQFNMMRVDEC